MQNNELRRKSDGWNPENEPVKAASPSKLQDYYGKFKRKKSKDL